MGYDLAARRGQRILILEDQIADYRTRLDALDEALNERDCQIMDLRDELAAAHRELDDLRAATWRPHH
jgi:chromosome segregation ATPase